MNHTKLASIVLLLAACGDNHSLAPDAGADEPDAAVAAPRAVVVSGSFTPGETGVMSALDLGTLQVAERVTPNSAVDSDPVMRKFDDELFVINRSDNNITIVDAVTFAVKEQIATGAGSNPQDVAVVGDKLYVAAFGAAGVIVATRGQAGTTTISLASLDPDGKPNCVSAFRVGTDIYVACGLLDASFQARGPGKVAVIDTTTDTVRTTITLANKNPFGVFEQLPASAGGDLVIPTVPSFGDITMGCVEKVKPGATPAADGCVVTNQAVGGVVARIVFQELGTTAIQWMVVTSFDTGPHGNLQGFDLSTNELWPLPVSPATEILVDVTVCPNDQVVVADQTMAANGLRVYEGGAEKTTAPLGIGLKPGSAHGLVCY